MTDARPLISIIIPTYNHRPHLAHLLTRVLEDEFLQAHKSSFEIIIANNKSTDGTTELLATYANEPRFRIIHHEVHVRSGEENWYRTLPFTKGHWVWIIGDDDLVDFSQLQFAWEELNQRQDKLYMFNPVIFQRGYVLTNNLVKMRAPRWEVPLRNVYIDTGFWYLLAMFSNSFLPGDRVRAFDFKGVVARSAIYSHVAAYLEMFSSGTVVLLNLPLIWYRQENDGAYYINLARRFNVCPDYFWLGFIKHLDYGVQQGFIDRKDLFYAYEVADYKSYRLMGMFVEKLFAQTQAYRKAFKADQWLSDEDFAHFSGFVLKTEPYFRDVLNAISDLRARSKRDRYLHPVQEFKAKLRVHRALYPLLAHPHARLFLRNQYGWDIYFQGVRYCAVRPEDVEALQWIKSPEPVDRPGVFYANEDLHKLLETLRIAPEPLPKADVRYSEGYDEISDSWLKGKIQWFQHKLRVLRRYM